jgi:hypothetical protein
VSAGDLSKNIYNKTQGLKALAVKIKELSEYLELVKTGKLPRNN